jgi:hypothetical protein
MVTHLHRNVTILRGTSYHLLGSQISQDSKIRYRLQVESYISDWQFSKSQHLASYVSRLNGMAYDRHAFTAIPAGRGLLTPCNKILQTKPPLVYLQRNPMLRATIMGCQTLLWESSDSPTCYREPLGGWPDYIGVCDVSSHGVSHVIVGKNEACIPIVFYWEWPQEVKDHFHEGHISNSDLEMASLLLLWMVIGHGICLQEPQGEEGHTVQQ